MSFPTFFRAFWLKFSFTLCFIGLLSQQSFAQQAVKGTVTDENGAPLPGVNVVIDSTTSGTTTDLDGRYVISLEEGQNVLVFSFVGYKTQRVPVNGRTQVDIQMKEDVAMLDQIVVIGYGQVKKSDLTGAVSSVKSEDLVKVPSVNPMEALQGKVAGVQVNNSSGAPGSSPVVRIRGVGTPGNPNPIYVVDGVITDDISYLNSADIKSVEVLKDASATAIYGSRGANGVIMITTKLGSSEKGGMSIHVGAEYSIQTLQKRIDLLNGKEFAKVANEITTGSYNNVDLVPNTNWQDLLYQTASIQKYQVSLSGSSDKNDYYFGVGYFDQGGIIPKSRYQRITLKINNKYKPKDFITIGSNVAITPFLQDNTKNDAPFNVYRAQPTVEPYQQDGTYNEVPGVGNILADLEYTTDNHTKGVRSVSNFYAQADFLNGFSLKSSFGYDLNYYENTVFVPEFYVSAAQQNAVNDLTKNNNHRLALLWENTLSYHKEFGKHLIDAVVGYTTQRTTSQIRTLQAQGLTRTDKDFRYINSSNIVPSGVRDGVDPGSNFNMISYLGRVNYTYDSRYLLTATFRRDGSSKFLGDNRYGNFPSFALGWNVINEDFMDSQKLLSNLKIRASWGIIGNEKVNYLSAYSTVANNLFAVLGQSEALQNGQSYGNLGNPNIKWEDNRQTDIGVELGFFNQKLSAELDYFDRKTSGILVPLQPPGYFGNGFASVINNGFDAVNSGVDYSLTWRETRGDWDYSASLNGTFLHNEVTKLTIPLGGTAPSIPGIATSKTVTITQVGSPIGAFYGYKVDGIFQNQAEVDAYPHLSGAQPGDLRFVDTNNDGKLTGDDRVVIGSSIPTYSLGLSLSANYKSFSLALDMQAQGGNDIYNIKETVRPDLYNFEKHVLDYWRGPGTSNTEPRPTSGGNNFQPSERFVKPGDFLRLRSATLSYALPESITKRLSLSKASVYLRGTNILTLMKYNGYSPEIGNSSPVLNGVDLGNYPVSSIYTVGLNFNF